MCARSRRTARTEDFATLPDYCPPLESLPDRANSLKVDWKGYPSGSE